MSADLTQRPPRSPRVRLGGYALLPRILDKCRATVAGKSGEYKFNCPLDQQFFQFTEIDAEAFKAEVQLGRGDAEMLEWVRKAARRKVNPAEICAWSSHQEQRTPGDVEMREYFIGLQKQAAPARDDIYTWFDLLDADDHVSFGGKA